MKKVRVLHRKQRIQIFYAESDDQADARATSSSRLDNSHWISFFTLRHGTGVALQKRVWTFPKIFNRIQLQIRHHGNNEEGKGAGQKPEDTDILCGVWWPSWRTCNKQPPTWQFPLNKLFLPFRRNKVYASWKLDKASISVKRGSHFQVHFVWQVWDGQAFKSIRLKAFGGWKFDRGTTKLHARIPRGKGVQKKKPNMFTVGSSTSTTFVLPVRRVALQKRVWTLPKIFNRIQLQIRHHGNNEENKGAAQKLEDTDILCGVWWPSWRSCNKQPPTWQFPLNKLFYPSGGTKFMLLESLTKHPSRSSADHISKSISCGRCGTVNYHPLLNL